MQHRSWGAANHSRQKLGEELARIWRYWFHRLWIFRILHVDGELFADSINLGYRSQSYLSDSFDFVRNYVRKTDEDGGEVPIATSLIAFVCIFGGALIGCVFASFCLSIISARNQRAS